MALTVKCNSTIATITLRGDLDIAVVDDVRELVKRVVAHEGLTAMHLDVTRVRFIDSAGLMILVRARQVALDHSLTFTLATEQHGPVNGLIDLCGFGGWFADKPRATLCNRAHSNIGLASSQSRSLRR